MKPKQIVYRICFFFLALIFLILPLVVHAADVPTPTIDGEVIGGNADDLKILVTWHNDDLDEIGYKVEKEGVNGRELAGLYNPNDTGDEVESSSGFYLDNALVPNDTYSYYVTAFDRAGNESAPAKITLVAALCQDDFTTFSAKAGAGTVDLAWNPICSAVEYKLYRDGNTKEITTTTENTYNDKNVSQGEHEYTVEVYDEKTTAKNIFIDTAFAKKITEKKVKVTVGAPPPGGGGGTCTNQVNTEFGFVCDLGDFVNKFMTPLIGILGGAAFLMMIIAGYIYMTSQGDESKITLAKDLIIGVITGILLLFLIGVFMNQIGAI